MSVILSFFSRIGEWGYSISESLFFPWRKIRKKKKEKRKKKKEKRKKKKEKKKKKRRQAEQRKRNEPSTPLMVPKIDSNQQKQRKNGLSLDISLNRGHGP